MNAQYHQECSIVKSEHLNIPCKMKPDSQSTGDRVGRLQFWSMQIKENKKQNLKNHLM